MIADDGVTIGYPVSHRPGRPLVLGAGARLRSGTVLYDASRIGPGLETGHGVVVREDCEIGARVRWLEPEEVGDIVIRAIRRGDLYAFTHPEMKAVVAGRHRRIEEAFDQG